MRQERSIMVPHTLCLNTRPVFSVNGPTLLNVLPFNFGNVSALSSFKNNLKRSLFQLYNFSCIFYNFISITFMQAPCTVNVIIKTATATRTTTTTTTTTTTITLTLTTITLTITTLTIAVTTITITITITIINNK